MTLKVVHVYDLMLYARGELSISILQFRLIVSAL